jgi:hypothetical protein
MTKAASTKQIIKMIGNENLTLYRGEGYWYFVYDDFSANKVYETRSVHVMRLSHLDLEKWVEEGKDFVAEVLGSN